ncbi:S-adenosylmethionine decarboxylase proenzyme [bacterium HR34]|nr:S-adenosylmethionine decarboxylase proenzyme [bacterium HR34]
MSRFNVISEFKRIDFKKFNSVKFLRKVFNLVCKEANFKVLHKKFHKLKFHGVTGLSHLLDGYIISLTFYIW